MTLPLSHYACPGITESLATPLLTMPITAAVQYDMLMKEVQKANGLIIIKSLYD